MDGATSNSSARSATTSEHAFSSLGVGLLQGAHAFRGSGYGFSGVLG